MFFRTTFAASRPRVVPAARVASYGRPDSLRQGYGGPPKLRAKAEGLHYDYYDNVSAGLAAGSNSSTAAIASWAVRSGCSGVMDTYPSRTA